MDVGRSLVTKIVDEGRLNEVTRSGITTGFLDEEISPIYAYIQRHFSEYKNVPSRDAVLRAFPNFSFENPTESLSYYIHEAKENYRRSLLDSNLGKIASVYTKDTQKAEDLLRKTLSELNVTQKSFQDVNVAESAGDRYKQYMERKLNPGADGILSNWSKMDYQTLGWHPEEFIVLVGEKYMGKSWIMLWLAYQAVMQGERVLFVTKEMSQEAVVRRFDSIYARVTFDSLRRGELTNIEEKRYAEAMAKMAESNLHFMVARQGVQTIPDIESKAVETDATIIFGDSIYLFDPDTSSRFSGETSKRLAISQRCKRAAQTLGVPFIVSVQAGRKKAKERVIDLDSIEWSNAFSQDADTVFFLHKDDLDKELHRAQMHLLKSRDGDLEQFFINQDYETMSFTERNDDSKPSVHVFQDDEEETIAI